LKKLTSILLILCLAMSLVCSAAADEVPQPEGGKKFETHWAAQNTVIRIDYEEEGYCVSVVNEIPTEGTGTEWFYNCYYHPEDDTLVSVSSSRQSYTFAPVELSEDDEFDPNQVTDADDEKTYAPAEYEGFDDENTVTVFSIDEHGRLLWKDGRKNAGADLEFVNIGRFGGDWTNGDEGVYVTIDWTCDSSLYVVVIQRVSSDGAQRAFYAMTGLYNEETKKLECDGKVYMVGEDNQLGEGEECDAFFSMMENGNILYETANGIELEADFGSEG